MKLYIIFPVLPLKHIHDCIILQRGEVWIHQASLIPLFDIEVPVSNQETELSCIFVCVCVLGVSYVCVFAVSMILLLDFGTVLVLFFPLRSTNCSYI